MNDKTASYIDLTTQGFQLFADAVAAANERALGYAKSLFEISTRPYASTAVETMARENFDRANQIVSLTISEIQTSGAKTAELGGAAIAHATKMQDAYFTSMRGAVDTGISNLNFVKDTTAQQIDEIAKRMEDVRSRTAAQVSAN